MNKINLLIVLIFSMLLLNCGKNNTPSPDNKTDDKQTNQDIKKSDEVDPAKAIMVEFEVKGDFAGMIKAWYKGKKGKVEYKMEAAGREISSQIFSDNEWIYMITDFEGHKQGMKFNSKKYAEDSKNMQGQLDVTSFRDNLKNYKKIGSETILNKECDIYEIKTGNTISVYKEQIPLKMVMGKTTMIAKNYEANLDLNDNFFNPPNDVKFTDAGSINKELENMKDMKKMDEKKIEEMMKKQQKNNQ